MSAFTHSYRIAFECNLRNTQSALLLNGAIILSDLLERSPTHFLYQAVVYFACSGYTVLTYYDIEPTTRGVLRTAIAQYLPRCGTETIDHAEKPKVIKL